MKYVNQKNFIWNILGVTANAFTSLFFLIIINRINGITEAGIFSYTFSIACLFYIVALYFNRTFQVADIDNEYTNNQYITNRLITSILTIIIIFLFVVINKFDLHKTLILMTLMIYKMLEAMSDCFHSFIQKKEQLYFVGELLFYKALLGIIAFGLIDYFIKNLIISIFSLLIINIIGLYLEIKRYKALYNMRFKFEKNKTLLLFKTTFPLFMFSFLSIYLCNCQKYIMEYFMSEDYQTIFGIIIMPATMLSLCGQYLISPSLNFLTLNYHKRKINVFKNHLIKISSMFVGLGFLVFIIAFFLGIPVLSIIYSIELNLYKMPFLLIIIGAIFYALSTIISSCLTILKKNKEQLYIFIISSIFSSIISVILIPKYQINGAGYAYLLTMVFHFIMSIMLLFTYIKKIEKSENYENCN